MKTVRSRTTGGAWECPLPANDNRSASYIATGGSWATPLAEPAHEAADVLAWPALERLVYRKDEARVRALLYWRNLNRPAHDVSGVEDAEDEPGSDPGQSWDFDQALEVRPRVNEMLDAAANAFRPRTVTVKRRASGKGEEWPIAERHGFTGYVVVPAKRQTESRIRLGSLTFNGNRLLQYGTTAKGACLSPIERPGKPPRRANDNDPNRPRTLAEVRGYLKLRGAQSIPGDAVSLERNRSGERVIFNMLLPLPRRARDDFDKAGRGGVVEARTEAQALGVDGSVSFEQARLNAGLPPAERCPDFIIFDGKSGRNWKGVCRGKGRGGDGRTTVPDGGKGLTEGELDRRDEAGRLRSMLIAPARTGSPLTLADVLDMATTDATAADVGFHCGYAPSSAEKYGTQLIDRALDALIFVASEAIPMRNAA